MAPPGLTKQAHAAAVSAGSAHSHSRIGERGERQELSPRGKLRCKGVGRSALAMQMVQQEGKEGGGKRRNEEELEEGRRRNTSTKEVPDVRKEMRKAAKGRNPRQSAM